MDALLHARDDDSLWDWSGNMDSGLDGRVALFTGPLTALTTTAARRLGNDGVRLVFAGPGVSYEPALQPLLYQFRRDLLCFDIELPDAQAVSTVVADVEAACGRLDMVIHTLGGGQVDLFGSMTGTTSLARIVPPLRAALTCSSAAIRHMARNGHGHVLHLVTRADVGALEVELMVLDRIRQSLERTEAPPDVMVSTIYIEDAAGLLPSGSNPVREARLLESFTARLIEEDGWIRRVRLEGDIGDLVTRVCSQTHPVAHGAMRSYAFPTERPSPPGMDLAGASLA